MRDFVVVNYLFLGRQGTVSIWGSSLRQFPAIGLNNLVLRIVLSL